MKTQVQKIKQVLFMVVATFTVWSCAQKKDNNVAATYTLQNGYCYSNTNQMVDPANCNGIVSNLGYTFYNGVCYSTSTNQPAPQTYCNNQSGYTLVNGICYQTQTNQPVAINLCQNNGVGQQCFGVYYYQQQNVGYNSGYQMIQCNGVNCRGLTLLDSTGRSVICQ